MILITGVMQVTFVEIRLLIILTLFFLIAILLIILFTFFYLLYKRKRLRKKESLQKVFYLLLEKIIVDEVDTSKENYNQIFIPQKFQMQFKGRFARNVMKMAILEMRNNITDIPGGGSLKALYNQMGLKRDALRNLRFGRRWFIKAGAIQELSRMYQVDCLRQIYKHVSNKNGYLRMEAQSAMINLWGFRGLRFLNFIAYPISEWQQIKLLQQLSRFKYEDFYGIEKWLHSANDSVVIFALKLIRVYHRFELYDLVANALEHPNAEVRKNCIITLMNIYTEKTASLIITNYDKEGRDCKLAILEAIQETGTEEVIPFLMREMECGENEYKLKAAQAIMAIKGEGGILLLESHPLATSFPWNEIIIQLKEEAIV